MFRFGKNSRKTSHPRLNIVPVFQPVRGLIRDLSQLYKHHMSSPIPLGRAHGVSELQSGYGVRVISSSMFATEATRSYLSKVAGKEADWSERTIPE